VRHSPLIALRTYRQLPLLGAEDRHSLLPLGFVSGSSSSWVRLGYSGGGEMGDGRGD